MLSIRQPETFGFCMTIQIYRHTALPGLPGWTLRLPLPLRPGDRRRRTRGSEMQNRSKLAGVSALLVVATISFILIPCTGIQADSKLLFAGCGGLCIMDPIPGAVPVSLTGILEFPEVEFVREDSRSRWVFTKGPNEISGNVAWSPDGTLIALKTYWGVNNQNSIYVLRSDGTDLQEIVTQECCYGLEPITSDRLAGNPDQRNCCDPHIGFFRSDLTWSPDGTEVAYIHFDGTINTYHINGELARSFWPGWPPGVGDIYFNITSIDWGPDGLIYFSPEYHRDRQIYTIYPDGSGLDSLEVKGFQFEVSPDGTTLAYTTDYPDYKIFLINLKSRAITYLTDGFGPEWSPDSQHIAFIERDDWRNRSIKLINLDGSGEQTIYEFEDSHGYPVNINIDWSPWLPGETSVAPASWGQVKAIPRK